MPPKFTSTLTPTERFWPKVDTSAGLDACWPWTASTTYKGYGQFYVDGRMKKAHRIAYEIQVGPIPDGLHIDHLCRNRACQNAKHMEPVTPDENAHRSIHPRPTHCPSGHPYSGENVGFTQTRDGREMICRACKNKDSAERRARSKNPLNWGGATACPKGHPYTGGNIPDNSRKCRVCVALATAAWRAKKNAASVGGSR